MNVDRWIYWFQKETPENDDIDVLFRKVVVLDFARILARLWLGRKYQLPSSHIMQLYRALHNRSIMKVGRSQLTALQEQIDALLDLYRTVKNNLMP